METKSENPVYELKDPIFTLRKLQSWLEDMVMGLEWMGGQVTVNGHKLEYSKIRRLVNHLFSTLPADQRIWGATLKQYAECLERHPWDPEA